MVGYKITDGGAGALQFRFVGEVNNQHIQFFVFGRGVSAEALEALDMPPECFLDVLAVAGKGLGFVQAVEQVQREIMKTYFIEGLGEGLADEVVGLVAVHFVSTR